jgi:hypothetical protein
MNHDEITAVLAAHQKWWLGEEGGARANLTGADLTSANLTGADLTGADLTRANLTDANLTGAKIAPNDLSILRAQAGSIRAYKLVTTALMSPMAAANGATPLAYPIGGMVEVPDADRDERVSCAAGVNVATLRWIAANWVAGRRVLVVEFTAADIAAIPYASDGKFRVTRCTVVGECDVMGKMIDAAKPKRVRKAAK